MTDGDFYQIKATTRAEIGGRKSCRVTGQATTKTAAAETSQEQRETTSSFSGKVVLPGLERRETTSSCDVSLHAPREAKFR